jgi:hypothetical protein
MCGIVGLFAGCELAPVCPKRALLEVGSDVPQQPYRSAFASWDERASARRAPRRELTDANGSKSLPLFSPSLVPAARHPLVRELGPEARDVLLTRHALRYLDFTAKLEHLVVNETVLSIAHGVCGIDLPDEMRLDAFRIYCDEGYHALFSADLMHQIQMRTGVKASREDPFFLTAFAEICEGLAPEQRPLARMLFVIVSETLITASLAESSRKTDMDPALRASLEDHASDEGRHHVYFAGYLPRLWAQLDASNRVLAAELLPDLLRAFLHPDLTGIEADLVLAGMSSEEAEQVVAETCSPEAIRRHTAGSSGRTVEYFRRLGALDHVHVNERLVEVGAVSDG